MGFKEDRRKAYMEKLKDPRWQKLRLQAFQRDDFSCQLCGSKTKTLVGHHRRYVTGWEPWEYGVDDIATLCWDCHEEEHQCREDIRGLLIEAFEVTGWFYTEMYSLVSFIRSLNGYLQRTGVRSRVDVATDLELNVNNDQYCHEFIDFIHRVIAPLEEIQRRRAEES